jgi:transcriptional regulator with XRE-family HTH domain
LQTKKTDQEIVILKEIGERVRLFRESKDLSFSQFGEIVKKDKSNLSKLEKGKFSIDANFLHYLLKAYPRFNLQWLITGFGTMEH